MKNYKPTISVGTTAYNEEKNIKRIIQAIFKQTEKKYSIKEFIIISDGSNDRTVDIVKSINDVRIKIVDNSKRKGQPYRIDQLLNAFSGDYLLYIDADLYIEDNAFIEKMLRHFKNKNVSLVGPYLYPLKAVNFLESAVNNYRYARENLYRQFDFGKTAFAAQSCFMFSKKFANKITLPPDILNFDAYCYFFCVSNHQKFISADDALVYYRSPQTIKDHINQSSRHLAGGLQLKEYFNPKIVNKGFYVPFMIRIKIMLYQLTHNPLGYIYLKILNLYCSFKSKSILRTKSVKWEPIKSSKNLFLNEYSQ